MGDACFDSQFCDKAALLKRGASDLKMAPEN